MAAEEKLAHFCHFPDSSVSEYFKKMGLEHKGRSSVQLSNNTASSIAIDTSVNGTLTMWIISMLAACFVYTLSVIMSALDLWLELDKMCECN